MSALFKSLMSHVLIRCKKCLSFLIGIAWYVFTLSLTMISSEAAPCFDNPQVAFNYLIANEKLETQARTQFTININRATEGELTSLNGIGSSKAQEIILYREMFGDFQSVDELVKVKGIGQKTIEKNRSRLSISN